MKVFFTSPKGIALAGLCWYILFLFTFNGAYQKTKSKGQITKRQRKENEDGRKETDDKIQFNYCRIALLFKEKGGDEVKEGKIQNSKSNNQ